MTHLALLFTLGSLATPNQVVVFPDRAQVTRVTAATCGARVPLLFDSIPPAAAADSFRARSNLGTIDGLRSELVRREAEFGVRREALNAQLDALRDERRVLDDAQRRAQDQSRRAQQFGTLTTTMISREMAQERPDLKAWQQAIDSALGTALAAAKASAETAQKTAELDRREAELRRQLATLEVSGQKQSYSVEVLISCPAGATAQVSLTYLVGGAAWAPVYEARADDHSVVELSTYATVHQQTGEDWPEVDLVLSTAVPAQNATPPSLKKLLVSATESPPEKKVLVRRDEAVAGLSTGASDPAPATTPGLVAKNQGLSVQLQVPEKTRIFGDGRAARVFVGLAKLKTAYELRVLPKLYPVAFRVAELTNSLPWTLLPGRVDVFRPSGLVWRYELERVAQGAPFTLTFGFDESVRVKRVVLEELKRDAGLFGGKKRFTYAYRFEVANYGKTAVDVSVADHLPISELGDISVSVGEKTTPGYSLGGADGIAKWKLALKSQERKSVDFAFRVEVPSSYETGDP